MSSSQLSTWKTRRTHVADIGIVRHVGNRSTDAWRGAKRNARKGTNTGWPGMFKGLLEPTWLLIVMTTTTMVVLMVVMVVVMVLS